MALKVRRPERELTEFGEPTARPARSTTLRWLALCAFAYLYAFPYQPQINNPNENVRFYTTAAIVEEGSYAIDTLRARWGWVNDAGVREGKHYSVKAPGTSLLGVPGYWAYFRWCEARGTPLDRTVALWICRVSASILPMLVFLFFLHGFLGKSTKHPALRDAVFSSIALGSLLYGYALLFVSHTQSAIVAFGALMCCAGEAPFSRKRAFLAGLFAASVTLFEYPGFMASLPLTLYAVYRMGRSRAPFVAAGCMPPVLAMLHFQWRAFGHPLTPGHRLLENPAFRALSEQGFFGSTGLRADAAFGLLLDPGFGLFTLTPILLAAPLGACVAFRTTKLRAPAVAALAACLSTYLLICSMNNWRGGWTIGPRYLAVMVPLLGFLALLGLDWLAMRARLLSLGFAVGAAAAGIVLSGLVSVYYPHVPEALLYPIPDLLLPLMNANLAPLNAGQALGVEGALSMLPVFAALALAGAAPLFSAVRELAGRARLLAVCIAVAAAGALAWPAWTPATTTPAADKARAFVLRTFRPRAGILPRAVRKPETHSAGGP